MAHESGDHECEGLEAPGWHTRAAKDLGEYDRERRGHRPPFSYPVYTVMFYCEWIGDSLKSDGGEAVGAGFFRESELPELSVSHITRSQILRLLSHHRDPALPTECDGVWRDGKAPHPESA